MLTCNRRLRPKKMRSILADIRFGLRSLFRTPGLTLVIVLSLAIGIGANTAIFSVVDALLLKPLPYPNPDRLAVLWLRSPGLGIPQDWPSPGQFVDIQNQNRVFAEMAISHGGSMTLTGRDQPERVQVLQTSSPLFHILGAKPLIGRLLLPDEDKPGKPLVAILSYGTWKGLFGGDPGIVGHSILLNGKPCAVVGVMQPEFTLNNEVMQTVGGNERSDIYLPLPLGADAAQRRGDENYNLTARLKPGVTMAQAQSDVAVIARRIREQDKRDPTFTISVVPLIDQVVGNVRRALLVLLGSVALVLLIACANVANLLLSRATARQKEVAIRTALGASWKRLVRQLLTESVLLGVLGGGAGLAIAFWSLAVVRAIHPGNIPRLDAIGMDGTVLAFTFGVSILTGLAFGIAPATRAVKADLNSTLKAGGRSTQGDGGFSGPRNRLRGALVVSELALSLMLLIGAGLLIRSFIRLEAVPPGFNPSHVISMRVSANGPKYRDDKATAQFYRELGDNIMRLPGVKSEGGVSALPFTPSVGWGSIEVEGYTKSASQPELQVDVRASTTHYFQTMEVPLIEGRFFDSHDTPDGQQVVIIDQKMAQRFWPHGGAVGKHVWFDPKKPFTIAGVVGVVKQYGLDTDTRMVVYFSEQQTYSTLFIVARTTGDPGSLANSMVREVHALDHDVPVFDVRTMDDRMYDSLARQRFATTMLGAFAVFAMILAAIGVYGAISYLVTQGAHDIGVRIALGASRSNILKMVVRRGMGLAGTGIACGLAGAAALTQLMASLLFGVSAHDVAAFTAAPVFLAVVALAACYVPARRATRVDPMVALRDE
jgi:predicted permease